MYAGIWGMDQTYHGYANHQTTSYFNETQIEKNIYFVKNDSTGFWGTVHHFDKICATNLAMNSILLSDLLYLLYKLEWTEKDQKQRTVVRGVNYNCRSHRFITTLWHINWRTNGLVWAPVSCNVFLY